MAEHADLLVEIGTEELPPKALCQLRDAFAEGLRRGLAGAGLAHGPVETFATPRRLAVLLRAVQAAQGARVTERRGPALTAAFDAEGRATPAAEGFARSCGVAVEALEKAETDKGAWLVHRHTEAGRGVGELVPGIIEQALATLPIPKRMRWASLEAEFVRPVHWAVVLFGEQVIECELLGVASGRKTRGHRFHRGGTLKLACAGDYVARLEGKGSVIPSFEARRDAVRAQVLELAAQLEGEALIDEALLDEVTALVEWPQALAGRFEERFLALPREVLVCTMKGNQKYFPVARQDGELLPCFITVANIRSSDPAQIVAGNERVIRPRLADAAFFWEQDRKQALGARVEALRAVVFQDRLGSLHDKAVRVAGLAQLIAPALGTDPELAQRAALLAKCDLLTEMVGEFPELQGTMGRYYAAADGEPQALAIAMTEQYQPRHAGDALPATGLGRALAIADRLDTLVGIFGIGQLPSGDKDPYALRRSALGVLRILIEGELNLDLAELLARSAAAFGELFDGAAIAAQVYDFMMERLRAYYAEAGIAADVFEAVLARRPTRPLDFDRRLRAVAAFRALPESQSLSAANKRIRNILRKTDEPWPEQADRSVLAEPAEQALALELAGMLEQTAPLLDAGSYTEALTRMAALRETVDRFFDEVLVMAEDEVLRRNRLALLASLSGLFLRVADLSQLQGQTP